MANFFILDPRGRVLILDPSGRFSILDPSGRSLLWTLVADLCFGP